MKCTYFHRNCWKKIAQIDSSHAMDISRITKVILKNFQKIGKMTPLTHFLRIIFNPQTNFLESGLGNSMTGLANVSIMRVYLK